MLHKTFKFWSLLALTALFFSATATARVAVNDKDPQSLVTDVYSNIIEVVSKDKDRLANDPKFLRQVLDVEFFPYLNKTRMVALMLGKSIWKNSTQAEKQAFSDKFFEFLIVKYGSAIALYNGQELKFQPVKQGKNTRVAEVMANVIQGDKNTDNSTIMFRLAQERSGKWSVYDISYGTTSIVDNFGLTYRSEIAKHGFEGLLKKLDADIAEARTGK